MAAGKEKKSEAVLDQTRRDTAAGLPESVQFRVFLGAKWNFSNTERIIWWPTASSADPLVKKMAYGQFRRPLGEEEGSSC